MPAWLAGDKSSAQPEPWLRRGYAMAAVQYRFSQEAIFPAQIHDCKAAIRWLRANARQYDLDANRIGVWGASAGGHLVALLGTSAGVADLEGAHGPLDQRSDVQAVCDWFGPSDLIAMCRFPSHMDHAAPDSPESQLVGGPVLECPGAVARANPITYISGDEPPFLIMHGAQDMTVPPNQSELLHAALIAAGVESELVIVPGAGHGRPGFQTAEILAKVTSFFDAHIR